ncbi:PREDICTED: leucine-rich repeat-containing protein 23 [Elephantulus edwardii]|uniref:leucine-rich repeat-containing protein 23 n=1 Tax=Elephantulus edwardii TaxID=28737 RepID=UPI0003F0D39E|nr:PREDICTED: leucine-rich repeat-containing protein 23 [Elephantulus edwardii]
MSDDELEDFETYQDDLEKEDDEKETEEGEEEYRREGEDSSEDLIPNPLTEDLMKEALSLLSKTGNGLAHAYIKLELKKRDLTDIYLLRSYIHLRYVDVSENHLTDLSPLNSLTHLLWLKADGNRLRSAHLDELPYLQIASFAYNQITDTEGICHPRLGSLDLKGNQIHMVTGLDPQKLNSLHTLELRGNQLESTLGINLPKLKNLFLAQNMLKKVEGLENLSNLTTLHLRDNQIETLTGFSGEMKSLQYLNLRGNMVADLRELTKLQDLPKLRALVLLENPCADESDYRQEALVHMAHLERLDKDFYEEEDRVEAEEIRQRMKEEQEYQTESGHEEDLRSNGLARRPGITTSGDAHLYTPHQGQRMPTFVSELETHHSLWPRICARTGQWGAVLVENCGGRSGLGLRVTCARPVLSAPPPVHPPPAAGEPHLSPPPPLPFSLRRRHRVATGRVCRREVKPRPA